MIYIGRRTYKYRGMIMSHMVADTLEELHEMAEVLGVRKYFQDENRRPHYDICRSNVQKALGLGAKRVDERDIIRLFRSKGFSL